MSELSDSPSRPGFYLHVVPAVLYVATIFYGGVARNVPDFFIHETLVPPDKLLHFLCFGVMQVVLYRALAFVKPDLSFLRQLVIAAVLASALGALLELVQMSVPYRDAEFMDWVADTLGAGVALAIVFAIFRRRFMPAPAERRVPATPRDSEG